ncbi:hypothetical protein Q5O14_05150 [Eubacteriaceae bacterium ES2]|nr:hypothetical protein Q5O14_05150 [Eubacteriaceae bacterium ES2]
MKQFRKILSFAFLSILCLISFCGCENIFFPYNVPVVLQENQNSQTDSPQEATIVSYQVISTGLVQDISYSGSNLLILNNAAPYSINIFDTSNNQLSTFSSSDKQQSSAVYDSYDTGIYYIEETANQDSNTTDIQLVWSDVSKNTTRIISNAEENVVPNFGIADQGNVVYGNNSNELILSDNSGNRTVYKNPNNGTLLQVAYIDDEPGFVFIAANPAIEDETSLYYARIPDDSNDLSPTLISENVSSFNVDKLNHQVAFVKNSGDSQSICIWQLNHSKPSVLATGSFGSVQFTPSGENIIYTQVATGNTDLKSQSIWIMDNNGNNPQQLTAPIKLSSTIVCHPFQSVLFFSIERNTDNTENYNARVISEIYQLVYQIQ